MAIPQSSTSSSSSASPPFPKSGIQFSVFQEFIDKCGGKSALANKRTEEVCQEFLMPMTKELKLSYCDLLKLEPNQKKIGTASVFISHAWKFLFLDVVQAIERHFQKEISGPDSENFYIWFDLFSNNQHIAGELDFQWWTQTFRSAIEQFNHTVIILAPWNNPIPFKRAWCLWEIYCSIITESKFEVALSDTEHFSLIDTMIYNFDAIEQMISNINCEQSECWKPEDRLNIFNAVRLTEGFDHINSIIMKKMHSWLLSSVCAEVESNARIIKDSLQYFQLQVVIGKIQLLQGNHREAKESFLKSFDFYHQRNDLLDGVEGMSNRKCYLEACLHLAEINLAAQGYDEVNQFFDIHLLYFPNEKILEENEMIKLKISFMMIKFKLLIECDAFRDSYEAILKYYKLSIEKFTKTSNLTITFMGLIGYLYYRLDEYEKSSRYFIEALNIIKTKNLSNYLFAIEIKYYYCLLLIKQSNFELCKQIMEQCYRFCDVRLGDTHPKTLLYYFLFQKANYLLQQGRDYGFMDYSAEIDCYRNLMKKLPMFLSVFSENSLELLEILRLFNSFEYHRYNDDILVHYMKSIKFHYARNPEKYRDEYYHVLLDLARSQSGNRSMLQVIDLENVESFENYNEAIQLMKPQLPLYRKELIDAYHTFGFLQSNLIEREKIFEESLLLEKEQRKVANNPQYFRKSDIKFFLADTYYRQGKYSKWWKYHWEHCIDSGTCGGYYDLNYNYALPFANCLRFCYYCGNFPCHYCWSCGGVTAKETNEPTFPCDGLCGFCCYFNFWFGIYCSWPCQFICLLPCDIYNLSCSSRDKLLIDHDENYIEQANAIFNSKETQTFFSLKELINKIDDILKFLTASGKIYTKIQIQEMLFSFLENYQNPSYYELTRIIDLLIEDYDFIQDFVNMENAIQRRLYLEIGRSGLFSKVLIPIYYRLVYSQLKQRRYCTAFSTYTKTFRLGHCCEGFPRYLVPLSCVFDIPFQYSSSFCTSKAIGRPYLALRNFSFHQTSPTWTISSVCQVVLTTPCVVMYGCFLWFAGCYQSRYGDVEGLENYRFYEEMSFRSYAQIKNLQSNSTTNDHEGIDEEIAMMTVVKNPSIPALINLDQPKSMRMERFEEDLVPRMSSNLGTKVHKKPEDLLQMMVNDDDDLNLEDDDQRLATKTASLVEFKLKQGVVLRAYGKIKTAHRLLSMFNKSSYGKNSIDILELLGELSYFYLGHYSEALTYYQQVVSLRQSTQGDLHEKTLASMFLLAECYRKTGNYEKSLEFHESLYKIYAKGLGEVNKLTRQSLDMVIHLCQVTWQFKKAYRYRLLYYHALSNSRITKRNLDKSLSQRLCFNYGVLPCEMILENCCCIPIVISPMIMNDFISSTTYCYDPICCKRSLMECVMYPLSSICCNVCLYRDPDCNRIPGCLVREPVK